MRDRDPGAVDRQRSTSDVITIGERVSSLSQEHPFKVAVVEVGPDGSVRAEMTWAELDGVARAAADVLSAEGLEPGDVTAVAVTNGTDHLAATLGAWRLGATVLPLEPSWPASELRNVVQQAGARLTIGTDSWCLPLDRLAAGDPQSTAGGGTPRSAHCTGGSTGRPRVILRPTAWEYAVGDLPSATDRQTGLDVGQVQLSMLPFSHAGFTKAYHGLALDHTLVIMTRPTPGVALDLIARHRVQYFAVVPAMMGWMLALPQIETVDLSSVETVHQSSAACPEPVKRAWLAMFDPTTLHEGYSSQERIGAVWIRGDEWLAHPGSVGRPHNCEVRILDESRAPVAPGVPGDIFMRGAMTAQPAYLGPGEPLEECGGFLTLGDRGYLDDDGYLHVLGRGSEMINVGGYKVFPTEVESVLLTHSQVRDVAAIARPHRLLGSSVHALVVPVADDDPPSIEALSRHCASSLARQKVPMSVSYVPSIPRAGNGKIRREALVSELEQLSERDSLGLRR